MNSLPDPDGRTARSIPVSIVDDSLLIREGLAQLFAMSGEIRLVGKHADPASLLAALATEAPEVVLTDIRMPPTHTDEGLRLAETLRTLRPELGVIVLSQHGNAHYAARLLETGAAGRGYLLKDRIDDLEQLVATIRAVAAGECRVDPQLVQALVGRRRRRSPLDELTTRQREILSDVAAGKSNLAIAGALDITQRAVEKHVSEIFARLGLANDENVSRRVQATLMYLDDEAP